MIQHFGADGNPHRLLNNFISADLDDVNDDLALAFQLLDVARVIVSKAEVIRTYCIARVPNIHFFNLMVDCMCRAKHPATRY